MLKPIKRVKPRSCFCLGNKEGIKWNQITRLRTTRTKHNLSQAPANSHHLTKDLSQPPRPTTGRQVPTSSGWGCLPKVAYWSVTLCGPGVTFEAYRAQLASQENGRWNIFISACTALVFSSKVDFGCILTSFSGWNLTSGTLWFQVSQGKKQRFPNSMDNVRANAKDIYIPNQNNWMFPEKDFDPSTIKGTNSPLLRSVQELLNHGQLLPGGHHLSLRCWNA